MHKPIQLLAVIPDGWLSSLTDALTTLEVHIRTAPDWQSALSTLRANPEIEVTICASVLSDATWKEALADVSRLQAPPQVIIAARYADPSLWYDVLEDGAYDLIVYPFNLEALPCAVVSASVDCQFERDKS
jgi:DNA-binding NtrC family response regulator